MMIQVGGLACRFDFAGAPSPGERAFLERFHVAQSGAPDFVVSVEDEPASAQACLAVTNEGGTSRIEWSGDDLLLEHPVFHARVPSRDGVVELRRDPRTGAIALTHLLRVSLAVRLPAHDCLPLHAAGVLIDGGGVAFTGRSGAGKTTLASTSPHPVLSDEFIVLALRDGCRWVIRQSGIWGGMGPGRVDVDDHPLTALVTLQKGETYTLKPVDPDQSVRALTGMLLVPPSQLLWRRSLELLDSLTRHVPVHRLEWSLDDPPWDRLARSFTG